MLWEAHLLPFLFSEQVTKDSGICSDWYRKERQGLNYVFIAQEFNCPSELVSIVTSTIFCKRKITEFHSINFLKVVLS